MKKNNDVEIDFSYTKIKDIVLLYKPLQKVAYIANYIFLILYYKD